MLRSWRHGCALGAALALGMGAGPATAHAVDTGFPGPAFTGASQPTGQKPQSKLWFHAGRWWAVLFRPETGAHEIFRAEPAGWAPTGTVVDDRDAVWSDVLADGARLHVLAAGTADDAADAVRYASFAYDAAAGSYTPDGAPAALTDHGVEAAVLDRDGTGTLWATFTHQGDVLAAHAAPGAAWTAERPLPFNAARDVTDDDISAVVRMGGGVGVLWSDQSAERFAFATHADGAAEDAWQESTALAGSGLADDHINLKSLGDDPAGQAFAVVKTSLTGPDDPLIELLVLDAGGTWRSHVVFRVRDGDPTRPQLAIDRDRRELYVFATRGEAGGPIAMKRTPLDAIAFAAGNGTVVLESAADAHLNNITTSKHAVDASMGVLPLLAGDDTTQRYWFNALPVAAPPGAGPPPPTGAPPAPAPVAGGASAARPAPAARPVAAAAPLTRLRLTALGRARGRALVIRLRTSAPLRSIRGVLVRGGRVTARGTRPRLGAAGRLRLVAARRLRPGRYELRVTGLDATGARVTLTRRVRVRVR